MLISNTHRFVIVTPARCGTRAIHRWMINAHGFWDPDVDVSVNGRIERHRKEIPLECAGYRVYMMVRPPRDRLLSIYSQHRQYTERANIRGFCTAFDNGRLDPWFSQLTDFARVSHPVEFIRLPKLYRDCRLLMANYGHDGDPPLCKDSRHYEKYPVDIERRIRDSTEADLKWMQARNITFD